VIDHVSEAPSDVARWCATLDEIESHVDRSERLLGEVTEMDATVLDGDEYHWSAPVGLGPVPAALQGRALSLLARLATAEQALSDQASLMSRRMASVSRPDPRRNTTSGTRFDSLC